MTVGGIFFRTAIAPGNECSRQRCDSAATGEKLLQKRCADAEPGIQDLRPCHMPKVLVRKLVSQNAAQLIVARLPQKTRGHQELTTTGITGIDLGLIDETDLHLIDWTGTIHGSDQGDHHRAEALGFPEFTSPAP